MAAPASARPPVDPRSLPVGALLTALVALGQISTSLYIPSLPSLVGAFAATPSQVNLTLGAFLAGFAVGQPVYGPLSDRFGRRPVLLSGLVLYVVACVACAIAPTIATLVALRFVQGVAACSGPVLGRAVVRDLWARAEAARVMALMGAALAVSPAVAPIVGGYLQIWFGWQAAFWFVAAVGLILLLGTLGLLAETNRAPDSGALRPAGLAVAYAALLGSPTYLGHTLCVAFVFSALMAFTAGAPFVFIDVLGMSPERFGMLAVFNVMGYLAGSLAAARLSRRLGVERLLGLGVGLAGLGGVLLAGPALLGHLDAPAVIVPMMVVLAGMGIVLPAGMAGAMTPFPRIAGSASALLGFVQMAVAGGASTLVGLWPATTQLPMALVVAGCGAAAGLSFILLVRRPGDSEIEYED